MNQTTLPEAPDFLFCLPSFLDMSHEGGCLLCVEPDDVTLVGANAVYLPADLPPECFAKAEPFLEAFSRVTLVGGSESARRRLADTLQEHLPALDLYITRQHAYRDCDSIAQLLECHGQHAVSDLWRDAQRLPIPGIVEVSQVEQVDISKQTKAHSGIPDLDQKIGGLYDGELSIWTGKRKEGKSTLLGLPILAAIREGRTVCVYSGELPDWRYKAWLLAMAAGSQHLIATETDTGKTVWTPRPEIAQQIELWWKDKLFLLDNTAADVHDPRRIVALLRSAHKRYGASMLVVDNLMTVDLSGEDYYRAQSRFVGSLVDLAHATGAHVHLVAHRRKGGSDKKGKGDNDDVSGSGDITNRADNVFAVSRMDDDESYPFEAKLEIQANRDFGESGVIGLHFDPKSRRYYAGNPNWLCGWEPGFADRQGDLFQTPAFTEIADNDPLNPY